MEGQCLTQVEGIAMRPISNVVLAGGLLAGLALSPSLLAGEDGVLDGCYVPVRGYAESASYSETEQLGKYRLVVARKDFAGSKSQFKHRMLRGVVIEGPLKGALNEDSTLNHVVGSDKREGFIFTANDTFEPDAVAPCNDIGGFVLEGRETLHPVAGTGIYSGLQGGGSVVVTGTVNTCTGLNDFEVVAGQGELCFNATWE
jgi:hypothetical protein